MVNLKDINTLIDLVKHNELNLPYVNLNANRDYAGWVSDFHIYDKFTNLPVKLDLNVENDLFVLFALASCWSRTGQWENSACFAVFLKMDKKDSPVYWCDLHTVEIERNNRVNSLKKVLNRYSMAKADKKVSFRSDYYDSMKVLADNWQGIKNSLLLSESQNDYGVFIDYISKIQGLGAGTKTMKIKIPLILRELRIQNIYKNIPGKWCCVPDKRVREAAADKFNIRLPQEYSMSAILKSSEIIYNYFGDLYDIPLFAYEDLKKLF